MFSTVHCWKQDVQYEQTYEQSCTEALVNQAIWQLKFELNRHDKESYDNHALLYVYIQYLVSFNRE
jgi:hypothetical protein